MNEGLAKPNGSSVLMLPTYVLNLPTGCVLYFGRGGCVRARPTPNRPPTDPTHTDAPLARAPPHTHTHQQHDTPRKQQTTATRRARALRSTSAAPTFA